MPFVAVTGRQIEYRMIPGDHAQPTLVFLHEGLGSATLWRDFPDKAAGRLGARALVYSRFGYGQSDGLLARNTLRFMHDEALDVLPALLDGLGIERPLLIGHSDGASIALIHAGAWQSVRSVVAMAPHVFIEPICLSSIRTATVTFENTDLAEKLARYHRDARKTFYGWADVWLDPQFKRWDIRDDYLPNVRCPILAIQGHDDEYGTMAQLDDIALRVSVACELLKLEDCGHSPFRDQPEKVLSAAKDFIDSVS